MPAAAFDPADSFNDRYEVRLPLAVSPQAAPEYAALRQPQRGATAAAALRRHLARACLERPHRHPALGLRHAGGEGGRHRQRRPRCAAAAKQVVRENADVLRADIDQLELIATPHAGDKWAAHLQQTWEGHEVWQATVRMVFHENGNLMLMGSDAHPFIDLDPRRPSPPARRPSSPARTCPSSPSWATATRSTPELMVLPVRTTENTVQYHLVYRVSVQTAEPLADWITHVDAHTGDVVWRYNNIHFDFEGGRRARSRSTPGATVDADSRRLPEPQRVRRGLDHHRRRRQLEHRRRRRHRHGHGLLQGPYVRVYNENGANAQFSGTATPASRSP